VSKKVFIIWESASWEPSAFDSDKGANSDKKSVSAISTKEERQSAIQRRHQQLLEDEELPFQQGLPLKEDNINSKIRSHNREIFMAFFRMLQTEEAILQHWKIWTTTNSSLNQK